MLLLNIQLLTRKPKHAPSGRCNLIAYYIPVLGSKVTKTELLYWNLSIKFKLYIYTHFD